MSAPIWRFSAAAGLAGPDAVLGVMMPSVDRVGRQFPLTLVTTTDRMAAHADLHFSAQNVFIALENIALEALEDQMTRDRLGDLLARINFTSSRHQNAAPQRVLQQTAKLAQPSIWTAILQRGPVMMVCDGLPRGGQINRLFDPDGTARQNASENPA